MTRKSRNSSQKIIRAGVAVKAMDQVVDEGSSGIFSFKKHNNGWENGKMDNGFPATIILELKKKREYDPRFMRLPNQALIDVYSLMEHVFGPHEEWMEQIKRTFINQYFWTLDELDNFVFPIIEKYYIRDQQAAAEFVDERFASKCAFFRESVDAIANSTVQPNAESYTTLLDDHFYNRPFDGNVAKYIAYNFSQHDAVNNLLRALKEALLRKVEGPFSFEDLKDKMLDDSPVWARTLERVLEFKENPTKRTFTSMVLNEAKEAHDGMLLVYLIVKVSLLTDPMPPFVFIGVEKYNFPAILKKFYFVHFDKKEEAASTDADYHLYALLSASYLFLNVGFKLNDILDIFLGASCPAKKGETQLMRLYKVTNLVKYAIDDAFKETIIFSKHILGFQSSNTGDSS